MKREVTPFPLKDNIWTCPFLGAEESNDDAEEEFTSKVITEDFFFLCLNVFSDGRKVSNYFQEINIQEERSWYIKISPCGNLPHISNCSRSAGLSSTSLMTLFSKDALFRRRSCRNEGKLHVALWQGRSPWNTQALWSPFRSTGHIRPSSISDFYLPSNPSHFFT